MRRRIRIYSFTVLCFYVTGCGGYRAVATPGTDEPLTIDEKIEEIRPSNDVMAEDEKTITYDRRVLPLGEIQHMERYVPSTAGTVALVVAGTGVATRRSSTYSGRPCYDVFRSPDSMV